MTGADILIKTTKMALTILGIGIFIFALIMGAHDYGENAEGLIKNLPNTWPWAILLVFIIIAWKNERIGGILITLYGIVLVYFFNFSGPNFWMFTFVLTMVIPVLGICLLLGNHLKAKKG